jgi:hypothetical protein
MITIYLAIAAIGVILQGWVLHLLVKREARRFPVLTLYCLVALLASIVASAALFGFWRWTKETAHYYWICEGISQLLIFCTLLELMWKARDANWDRGRMVARMLTFGLIIITLAVATAYDPVAGRWLTRITRNLSFGSMLVCFGLWTMLMRTGDRRLLLICAGLGIPLAGSAIGHAFREMSPGTLHIGNLTLTLSYLAGQYIWIRALAPDLAPATRSSREEWSAADVSSVPHI